MVLELEAEFDKVVVACLELTRLPFWRLFTYDQRQASTRKLQIDEIIYLFIFLYRRVMSHIVDSYTSRDEKRAS